MEAIERGADYNKNTFRPAQFELAAHANFGDLIEGQNIKSSRPHNNTCVLFIRDDFVLHLVHDDITNKVKFAINKFTTIFNPTLISCRVDNLAKLAAKHGAKSRNISDTMLQELTQVDKFDIRFPKHRSQKEQMLLSIVKYDKPLWSCVDEEDGERRQSVEDYFSDLNPWGYQHYEDVIRQARPGDLIEIKRSLGLYRHWTVYVGDGNCIHVGERTIWNYKIVRESLAQICASEKYLDLCRINNLKEWAERKGVKARDGGDVVKIAETFLGTIFEFELLRNNCEHFATLCKFGDPISRQVERKTGLFDVIVFDLDQFQAEDLGTLQSGGSVS